MHILIYTYIHVVVANAYMQMLLAEEFSKRKEIMKGKFSSLS